MIFQKYYFFLLAEQAPIVTQIILDHVLTTTSGYERNDDEISRYPFVTQTQLPPPLLSTESPDSSSYLE